MLFLAVGVILFPGMAEAQSPTPAEPSVQPPAYDEKEAQRIDRMLMCPVCPAETIDQAQVEYSRQMRRVVRQMLAQGATRQEILDFFAARYGPQVLAAPPKSGLNLLAWVIPVVAVLAAVGAGLLIIKSMAGRNAADNGDEPVEDDELAEYLDIIDQDLSLSDAGGGPVVAATDSQSEEVD